MFLLILVLFFINLAIFLYFKKFAEVINVYDAPDKKLKLHKKKTPILGGLILIINYSIYLLFQLIFSDNFLSIPKKIFNIEGYLSILILIFGFFILGFYDDKNKLAPKNKLFFSILLILVSILLNKNLILNSFSLTIFTNKVFLNNFSIIFTIFCIILLINALNFFDGINGQSCIFFIIVFSFLFFKSEMNYFYLLSILLILFILFLNLMNKLFLGDGGIFLMGIIASISLILEHNVQKNILYVDEIFFLLLLPGIDLIRLTIIRVFKGRNAFFGDRNHIHHLLVNKFSIFYTNLILVFVSLIPIIMFLFLKLNFFIVFFIFLILYIFIISTLRSHG
jgi:UDP-GlcNAc:undecaprenyl-phosphate/decaprenyl-phosphate GlcNAc-1-phosphate transferase